ncbi:MAG: T9SS type A sorting domain-containing protein [Candidatus Aegiribacteria sp.]|nr:T9SS type A sorting domain-containing protein [Candidatus Aegiribacteria sp.]
MLYLSLLLIISSIDIDYPDYRTAWPLNYDAPLRRGYGQYNYTDDFHRALDFHGSVGDLVDAPYPDDGGFWVLRVSTQQDTIIDDAIEGSALIGRGPYAYYGWHYGHIDVNHPRLILADTTYFNRVVISELVELPSQGSHVHFSWLGIDSYEDPYEQPGYFNPIDYLTRYWGLYNEAEFGPTDDGPCGAFASITGIIFATEGVENVIPAQDKIYEVIDLIVRPYTYYNYNPQNDSCITRKVMWRILRQNPSNLEYETYQPALLGTWRTLYDFSDYIFDDNDPENYLDEYKKVFFGGFQHWSNNICLTNSCVSARGDASFPGVETVWINPYSHQEDYNAWEFCRGGWDTRLCTSDGGNRANIDEAATFMDGRYAIEVMAFPERLDNKTSIILPVDDITVPESPVTGVIVNNWAPRLTSIRLQDNPSQVIWSGSYEVNVPNNQGEGRTLDSDTGIPSWAYIGTGDGYNEYSLQLLFSEPVTNLASTVSMKIQLVTGLAPNVEWEKIIPLALDETSIASEGGVTSAVYHSTGVNCDQPPDYMGNQIVDLTINGGLAYDLAEKHLDADASTIVPAFGSGGSGNYEMVHHLIMESNMFDGYRRTSNGLDSEQDSRATIFAYYDAIYTPNQHDNTDDKFDSIEYISHEITPTGAWAGAQLLHETNWSGGGSTSCNLYGGAWMCKATTEDVLHAYIIDYNGAIIEDRVIYDPGTSEIQADIYGGRATTVTYPPLNPYEPYTFERDRYGWIGWRKCTIPDEPTYPHERNIELFVTMYDAYNMGNTTEEYIGSGAQWFEEIQPGKTYRTRITNIGHTGLIGGVRIEWDEYTLGVTTPISHVEYLDPPESDVNNSISQDNLSSTELSSRDSEIDDYFTIFPNPVVSSLSINFMSSEAAVSTVRIYDISGHLLNTFVEESPGMQHHHIQWDLKDSNGHSIPTGIYYVSLVSGNAVETKTVIVIH